LGALGIGYADAEVSIEIAALSRSSHALATETKPRSRLGVRRDANFATPVRARNRNRSALVRFGNGNRQRDHQVEPLTSKERMWPHLDLKNDIALRVRHAFFWNANAFTVLHSGGDSDHERRRNLDDPGPVTCVTRRADSAAPTAGRTAHED